jgi:hypothetical protein
VQRPTFWKIELSLIVALLALIGSFFVPEVRQFLRLERPPEQPQGSQAGAPTNTDSLQAEVPASSAAKDSIQRKEVGVASSKQPDIQNERAKPYQEAASNIAERAAMGTTNAIEAKGLIRRYNNFVHEAKTAFGNCSYIQALQELPYFEDYHQATGVMVK